MPYIDDKNKPSFLNRPPAGYQEKPAAKSSAPSEKEDKSLLGEKSQVARFEFEKSLRKNQEIRQELAKELKIRPNSPEMNAAIKDLKEKVPKIFGGYIDKREAERLKKKFYWDEKHELQEMAKDGITSQESKQLAKSKIKNNFLKRLFGIDKE